MGQRKQNEFFEGIRDGMLGVIDAMEKGRRLQHHEVEIPEPKPMSSREIVDLRKNLLKTSQRVFADLVNVAPQTVQAWEQGRNLPTGAALRLLRLTQNDPSILARILGTGDRGKWRKSRPQRRRPRRALAG